MCISTNTKVLTIMRGGKFAYEFSNDNGSSAQRPTAPPGVFLGGVGEGQNTKGVYLGIYKLQGLLPGVQEFYWKMSGSRRGSGC